MIIRKPMYSDDNIIASLYIAKLNEVFSFEYNASENTKQANYLIYLEGELSLFDDNDEVRLVRHSGETTDSSTLSLPNGVYYFEATQAPAKFVSILKKDGSLVKRIEHRLTADASECNLKGLVFLATGQVSVNNGSLIQGPLFLNLSLSSSIVTSNEALVIELT